LAFKFWCEVIKVGRHLELSSPPYRLNPTAKEAIRGVVDCSYGVKNLLLELIKARRNKLKYCFSTTSTLLFEFLLQPMYITPWSSILNGSRVLLAALPIFLFAQAASAIEMVSVDRDVVNLRSGASTSAPVLFELGKGYPLEVTSRKGQWLKVRDFENDKGWIYRPMVGKKAHLVVKANVANVRSAPSTRSRILGKVQYGELLRTLEHRSKWVRVERESGSKGWVSRGLLWGW
jgi:SH3-like domain-containing protein